MVKQTTQMDFSEARRSFFFQWVLREYRQHSSLATHETFTKSCSSNSWLMTLETQPDSVSRLAHAAI